MEEALYLLYFLYLTLVLVIATLGLYYKATSEQNVSKSKVSDKNESTKKGAVATTNKICSQIAADILKKGGSAADAVIAAVLCEGVCSPQSSGIGGGFLLTYYEKETKTIYTLNARECAPEKSNSKMFTKTKHPSKGGLSVAVPGEIYGFWELHQKLGKLPWADLFTPTIRLCREGIPLTVYCCYFMGKMDVGASETFKSIFCKPGSNELLEEGQVMLRPALANTLEMIAKEGANAFYNGKLTDGFVKDIQENGGIITRRDMEVYRPQWMPPISMQLPKNLTIYSMAPPSSGTVLFFILDTIIRLGKAEDPITNWFRIVEAWKHAFGYRVSLDPGCCMDKIPDFTYDPEMAMVTSNVIFNDTRTSTDMFHYAHEEHFCNKDSGTAHMSILAPNGDGVAITTSVNGAFGAMFASKSTGIILNNHMMDFCIPDYDTVLFKYNQIAPGKQPMSSMSPSIVIDNATGDVRLVIGAAGGYKIITSISQVLIEHLVFDISLGVAVAHKRLHHHLLPMVLYFEEGFSEKIIEELEKLGHKTKMIKTGYHNNKPIPGNSCVAVIGVENNQIQAFGDPRRGGASVFV